LNVVYHPDIQTDVSKILHHYDRINPRLGDEFWAELNSFIQKAATNPGRFHFESPGRRRVNLRRFP
jgi:plasmid stabilization system protein ParE